jgi:hypothetical protein
VHVDELTVVKVLRIVNAACLVVSDVALVEEHSLSLWDE